MSLRQSKQIVPDATDPASAAQSDKTAPVQRAALSWRAWLIGLLLIPLVVYWVEYTEIVAEGPDMAAMSLPMATVVVMLGLLALNRLAQRFHPIWALNQAELLAIYSMNAIAVGICGIGMMQFLTPELVGWSYYATPANGWANIFLSYIRPWAVPNPSVAAGYYAGHSSFFTSQNMIGWSGAILIWTLFIVVLLSAFYCVAVLIRKQWVERERLIFPIVQIPFEITRDGGSGPIWRNKGLWLGIGLPVILESLAAIHFTMLPMVPYLPIKPEPGLEINRYLTTTPWSAVGYMPMEFYPFVIGLMYLVPLDVSFSCWFFYLISKLEVVVCAALGFSAAGASSSAALMPYLTEQTVGAWVGLALMSLYFARPHLVSTWKKAFGGDSDVDDSTEPLSYRAAYIGLFVTCALLVGFSVALGISLGISVLFWLIFLLLILAFSRIRAEAGIPWLLGPGSLSHVTIVQFGGSENFTTQQLTGFAFLRWFDADCRCIAQPSELEAMKMAGMAEPRPLNARTLTKALLAAVVVGTLSAWVCCLAIYYHYGAASAIVNPWRTDQGHYGFDELVSWVHNPQPFNTGRLSAGLFGFAMVAGLSILRSSFSWWPLHPIGYAICGTDTMTWLWMPTLISWLSKLLILRYSGIKGYRQGLPFFIGLVIGDYGISGIWALIFLIMGEPGYRTFPN